MRQERSTKLRILSADSEIDEFSWDNAFLTSPINSCIVIISLKATFISFSSLKSSPKSISPRMMLRVAMDKSVSPWERQIAIISRKSLLAVIWNTQGLLARQMRQSKMKTSSLRTSKAFQQQSISCSFSRMRLFRSNALAPGSEEQKLASTQQPSLRSIDCELMRKRKMRSRNGEQISVLTQFCQGSPRMFPRMRKVRFLTSALGDSRPFMSASTTSQSQKNQAILSCLLMLDSSQKARKANGLSRFMQGSSVWQEIFSLKT